MLALKVSHQVLHLVLYQVLHRVLYQVLHRVLRRGRSRMRAHWSFGRIQGLWMYVQQCGGHSPSGPHQQDSEVDDINKLRITMAALQLELARLQLKAMEKKRAEEVMKCS